MKKFLKNFPFSKRVYQKLNNQFCRDNFVKISLENLHAGGKVLDAGCGSQRYKKYTAHLEYKAQDFGEYKSDDKKSIFSSKDEYQYGDLDYIGDIWNIDEDDSTFDAILCTEVFEHIPYPNETIKEFGRLLKTGGILILTFPANSLRHFDPYYFYPGFSDRWAEKFLRDNNFEILQLDPVGDYYSWMAAEVARTAVHSSLLAKVILLPSFLYYFLKKETNESINSLCSGYHVIAKKSDFES